MSSNSERDAQAKLTEQLHNPFQAENSSEQDIVDWVVQVLFLFLVFIQSLFGDVERKIIELQNRPLAIPAPATSTAQATTQQTSQKQGKRPCCSQCHARGHLQPQCLLRCHLA